ncbi:cytochrome c oxidase subunit II [Litchfieldia alkalitelluris]|uniref:cytochrome c oxidase subunit II n=1 Tax=Litchfieldia alkalitelluris TaxID=304268 RepID=UPI000998BD84|nr:cytochrome c oxidase subunit II [Litchfieldia alkalitelluris]
MKNWLPKLRFFSLFALMALMLAGCGEPFISTLQPAGEVADMQYSLMILSTAIMVLVVIVVSILFIYAIVRFRRKKGDETIIPKQVEGSHKLEMIWTIIPILLLIVLAVPVVSATFKLADVSPMEAETRDEDALIVKVTANLYWWEFNYPDLGIVTGQELVVPTDERVYFELVASDVKHSFWIPSVGGKMDTNTDNVNKFFLEFDQEGTDKAGGLFYGKCAELCGPSHALMDFKVKPLPREEFDQWVSDMQNAEVYEPTTELASQGEQVFNQYNCIGCHAIDTSEVRPTAPNLANFGERSSIAGRFEFNEENLKKWIRDPEAYKPGNLMTKSYDHEGMSEEELDALAEYLLNLKVQD